MSDQSRIPTLPPPPDPSADAIYITETLLSKLSEMRLQFNTAIGDLHKKISDHVVDVRVAIQAASDRVIEVHQIVPSIERRLARMRSDIDDLKAEWTQANSSESRNGGSHR